jgi:ABC-type Co2+ transport system permease subunit
MINSQFTAYTIIIRYVFFVIALVTGILYIYRFNKIPDQHKIIEQKMIAVASILLLMFNDPLYPVTILKPNGARYIVNNLVHFLA